jgi:protein arginine N-methyltransferase 7
MDLVEAVNDFHYAMLGDEPRNEFYLSCLKQFITPESIVLEIGTGTGLLAMLAAQCGAKRIYAIEANRDMARLAQNNIAANNLSSKITILNMLSTEVTARDLDNNRPNVVLSELFGTLLLGESAHVYIRDAVKRLCSTSPSAGPNPAHGANVGVDVIPRFGAQFATLIHSPALERITSVTKWNGIELSTLNSLKDTVSVVFTKSYGFRFSTIEHEAVAPRVAVLDMDFATVDPETMPSSKRVRVKCDKSGTVHAILLTWEAYSDLEHTHTMSTEPAATKDNFPRDMQWGQALQLVEDFAQDGPQPMPFVVSEGEEIDVLVRFSSDGVLMQFELQHLPAARPAVQQ